VHGNLGGALWFPRIFILPHTLIGIGVVLYLIFVLLWALLGADIPGTVIGSYISHSSKHGDSYYLKYRYQAGGETKRDSDSVSLDMYERYQSGNGVNVPVTVHYFGIGSLHRAGLREGGSLWKRFGGLVFWAAFWNSIMFAFIYQFWVKPLRVRWLYRHGDTVPGTLTKKRVRTGKSTSYYVSYAFNPPFSGERIESEIEVWKRGNWDQAVEGQPVTVLYSGANPKRSTVYEYGGYRVDGV
jgi:hypothetical protein